MALNERISDVARTVRVARRLSIVEVAQRSGIHESTIRALEHGRMGWTSETILSVACALGIRPAILLMTEGQRLRAQAVL